MGRWAFFNTGIEYKFALAVQPSGDILRFSGMDITEEEGEWRHLWVRKWHLESAKALLSNAKGIFQEPKWDSYPETKEGTSDLLRDLYDTVGTGECDESVYRFILGCSIVHQLMYMPVLTANYEG